MTEVASYLPPKTNEPSQNRPLELHTAYDGLIHASGTGTSSRSSHLTESGLYNLQQIVDDFAKKYGTENRPVPSKLTIDQVTGLISAFESNYATVKAGDRTAEQQFFATAARLYRAEIKKAEASGNNSLDTNVFQLLVEKSKHNRTSLSAEGRHYIQSLVRMSGCENAPNQLNPEKTFALIDNLKAEAQSTTGAESHFKRLAARSLEWKLDKQIEVGAYQSMDVSNSPWERVVHTLAEAGIGGPNLHNEAFVRMLIAPHVTEVFRKISEFANSQNGGQNLELGLLTHTFAENLNTQLQQVLDANSSTSDKLSPATVIHQAFQLMADASSEEDLGTNELIEIAVCKVKYLSQMPQFLIDRSKQELAILDNLLGDNGGINKFILEQIGATDGNNTNIDIGLLQTAVKTQFQPPALSGDIVSQLVPQSPPQIDNPTLEDENLISHLQSQFGDQFSRNQALEMVMNLENRRKSLTTQISEDQIKTDYLQNSVGDVYDRDSLADSLNAYWTSSENILPEESSEVLLQAAWLPKDLKDRLLGEQNEARVNAELTKHKAGLKEKLYKFGSGVSEKIKHLLVPSRTAPLAITERYQQLLQSRRDIAQKIVDNTDFAALAESEINQTIERNQKLFKAINLSRVVMSVIGLSSETLSTFSDGANLQHLIEDPTPPPSDDIFAKVHDFINDIFVPKDGLTIYGQNVSAEQNQQHIAALAQTEIPHSPHLPDHHQHINLPDGLENTIVDSPDVDLPDVPENTGESQTIFEFLLGKGSALHDIIVAARLDHLESLTPEQQSNYLSAIGGAENLNTARICLGIIGEDSTADTGARPYEYGHADQTHLMCYDPDTNTLTDISFPRHLKLPENDGGFDVTQATWRDNPETGSNRSAPQGLDILQQAMVDAIGVPVDGVLSLNMDAAVTVIDSIFPNGIQYPIGEGEGFVPQNESLGQITGYAPNGYQPFEEGKIYTFNGRQIVDFLRSRFTSADGSYSREERAGGVLGRVAKLMIDQIKTDPVNAITKLSGLGGTFKSLEASGDLRYNLDVEVTTPSGESSRKINDVASVMADSLLTPGNLASLATIATQGVDAPSVNRFSLSPSAEQAALQVVSQDNNGSSLVPRDQQNQPQYHNPLAYWQQVRDFFGGVFNPEPTPESNVETVESPPTPTRVMTLGDSQISSGFIPKQITEALKGQNIDVVSVGSQSSGPSGSNGYMHEGHPSFTTRDILRDLTDGVWNDYNGTETPVLLDTQKPDIVFIQLGTNDAAVGGISTQETIANLQAITDLLRQANPNVQIVIGSVPPLADAAATERAVEINRLLPTLVSNLNQNPNFPNSSIKFAPHESIDTNDLSDGVHIGSSGQQDVTMDFINGITGQKTS